MKLLFLLPIVVLFTSLSGCSTSPTTVEVKQDHYRFENFFRDIDIENEHIFLACHLKRPTDWQNPKQYKAGEQNLWITARVGDPNFKNLKKEAHFNFNVYLESGKSYMPNRKIDGDKISLWISEVNTGKRVSEVQVADLEIHLSSQIKKTRRCEASTV